MAHNPHSAAIDNNKTNNAFLDVLLHDEWTNLQAYHLENASMWRTIAVIALMALTIVSIIAIYFVSQDKHKTLVFAEDKLGNITALGITSRSFDVDNKVIAHQLVNFIVALREVPSDSFLRRRNINIVHKMIDPKLRLSVDNMIIHQYQFAAMHNIVVRINKLQPLPGGKSWDISWSEQILPTFGDDSNTNVTDSITHWSSVVSFVRQDDQSIEDELINPIGLFITYLNPSEDISDGSNHRD